MRDALTVILSASAPVGTAAVAMSAPVTIRTLCQVLRRMSQLLRRGCGNPRCGGLSLAVQNRHSILEQRRRRARLRDRCWRRDCRRSRSAIPPIGIALELLGPRNTGG